MFSHKKLSSFQTWESIFLFKQDKEINLQQILQVLRYPILFSSHGTTCKSESVLGWGSLLAKLDMGV